MPLSRGLFPVSSLLCVPFTILFHFTISFYSIRIFKIMINSEVMIMLVSFVSNRVILFFPLILGNVLGGAADFILPSKLHRFLIRTGAELIEKFVCCLFMKVVLACQEDRPQQLWVRPRYACLVKPVLLDPSCSSRISTRRYIHLMAKSINTCLRVFVCGSSRLGSSGCYLFACWGFRITSPSSSFFFQNICLTFYSFPNLQDYFYFFILLFLRSTHDFFFGET